MKLHAFSTLNLITDMLQYAMENNSQHLLLETEGAVV